MNSTLRASLKTSKHTRPITSLPKDKTFRKSATATLTMTKPISSFSKTQTRPMTRSSLAVKEWRHNLFPTSSPASKREVELLGEWLNSVLAENLEKCDNPLDICTNAQHWYSVAFNELVRQVSIDCAERGRLFAVIWKRNQDLLQKMVQVQREERQYILQCHKDRISFLKTDLEFSKSRLATVSSAYEDETTRWTSSHNKDVSKFQNLQNKIDEQVKNRNELMNELNILKEKLGLPIQKSHEIDEYNIDDDCQCYSQKQINSYVQEFRWRLRNSKINSFDFTENNTDEKENIERIDNREILTVFDKITYFADFIQSDTINVRRKYEQFFLSLPADATPTIRTIPWTMALISYIYSYFMTFLSSPTYNKNNKSFPEMVYEILLNVYGIRVQTEQVLLDFLSTIKQNLDTGIPRLYQFARFFGIVSPISIEYFYFYMYSISMMNRAHTGPLFPEVEAGDTMISGIPAPAACSASQKILEKFTTGRSLKFYTERLNKIASDGFMRFGGKNLAELDNVLNYILTAFIEEYEKIIDSLKEKVAKFPDQQIKTFSTFFTLITGLKIKLPPHTNMQKLYHNALKKSSEDFIDCQEFMKIIVDNKLCLPMEFDSSDFLNEQNPDDVIKFLQIDFQDNLQNYEELLNFLEKAGDEILLKQIKSSRAKFDQALTSRNLGRTFQAIHREFYEKIYTTKFFHKYI
ncbi:hypothetical protein TRFO_28321 [Tritrichomonas foetus]|uniref:Uncharacterized protein n=1 Tax=Tritrichomonas foetus TaxID=1144522 RepID=A0A1J4JYI2_9EUKA|nr:hypothetical protein TRFO_28321 [Tritrichomonas foetus]|eukprot:OHT04217.1 hypothetical protein TRFO_28321 [Tritrichomonas foetus]